MRRRAEAKILNYAGGVRSPLGSTGPSQADDAPACGSPVRCDTAFQHPTTSALILAALGNFRIYFTRATLYFAACPRVRRGVACMV
jgi:hypothetical protein